MNGQCQVAKEKKFMEKFNIILVCLLSNCIFAQKTIIPKSGIIVFTKEEKVSDKDLYLKSFKEFLPKMNKVMEEQIYLERITDGKKVDTVQLRALTKTMIQNMELMLPMIVNEYRENIKFYNEFKDDIIFCYNTTDNGARYNEKRINQVTGTVINQMNEHIEPEKVNIIKIAEFRNEQKQINNFNCFKVVYTYTNSISNSDFDLFSTIEQTTREIWVTETIKCNYHPIINDNEILDKYYPLQILEYSEQMKGFETNYTLSQITLM